MELNVGGTSIVELAVLVNTPGRTDFVFANLNHRSPQHQLFAKMEMNVWMTTNVEVAVFVNITVL